MKIKIIYISIVALLLSSTVYLWWQQSRDLQLFDQSNLLDLVRQQYPDKGNVYSLKKLHYNWAVVSVRFTPGGGAEVIAKNENGVWHRVAASNDLIDCALIEQEQIPVAIYEKCINYKTGAVYPSEVESRE